MANKMYLAAGVVLIIIAIILGVIQHFGMYNLYGSSDNKWYFWTIAIIIGIIGIILAAYAFVKTESSAAAAQPAQT